MLYTNLFINRQPSNLNSSILSEQLRPHTLDDLTFNKTIKDNFIKIRTNKNIQNMLFYGKPGTGKTTTAQLLADQEYYTVDYFDLSVNNSPEYIKNTVLEHAQSRGLFGVKRLIILDESDGMSQRAQSVLKVGIEYHSAHCRFILITNEIDKIIDPLKSRLKSICFDPLPSNANELVKSHTEITIEKLKRKGNNLTENDINKIKNIIQVNFPDYRAIANEIEFAGY